MRRIGIPVVLALAATGLAGPVTPAAARTPLSVERYCWINAWGGSFACHAVASGGTGSYVTYTWKIMESRSTYQVVTSSEDLTGTCTVGNEMIVTVTVKDSGGATASPPYSLLFECSELMDETPQWPAE